jgi:hypothetical protein
MSKTNQPSIGVVDNYTMLPQRAGGPGTSPGWSVEVKAEFMVYISHLCFTSPFPTSYSSPFPFPLIATSPFKRYPRQELLSDKAQSLKTFPSSLNKHLSSHLPHHSHPSFIISRPPLPPLPSISTPSNDSILPSPTS